MHPTKLTIHAIKTLQYGGLAYQITHAISDLLSPMSQASIENIADKSAAISILEQITDADIPKASTTLLTQPATTDEVLLDLGMQEEVIILDMHEDFSEKQTCQLSAGEEFAIQLAAENIPE